MITRSELHRLAGLRSDEGVVSVYIGIEPRLRFERDQHAAKFKGAVKRFQRETRDAQALVALDREHDHILEYLNAHDPGGRGIAVFASIPAGIWEVVELDVRVSTYIAVDPSPSTALLAAVLDEYPRYAVVVVQRDQGSIYLVEQRRAEEAAEVRSDVPGRHDQGGWSQARFQRHIEAHVERHMKRLLDELEELAKEQPFQRLVVGGPDEPLHEFLGMLPKTLHDRVAGTFGVSLKHGDDTDIIDGAHAVIVEDERRHEQELVDRVAEAAGADGRGALGLRDTIRAVNDGRVQTLLVADGVTAEGSACPNCDYVSDEAFSSCPACGSDAERVSDIIERAVERTLLSSGRVEAMYGTGREWLLARGGIGALLRY